MKGLKKILTGILAGAMALSITLTAGTAMTAKADNDGGSITVSNTTKDAKYELYKVFDATYSGSNVAYTYTGSSEAFKTALKNSTVFDYDGVNVVKKSDAKDGDVLEFIKVNANEYEKVDEKTGTGTDITFTGLAYGYYYVKSGVGGVVTINSAVPTATVIDKNQGSTVDKQESVDGGNTWLYQEMGKEESPIPTAKIGDTVNYKVVGTLTQYIGEDEVTKFTFTDTMSTGLTPDANSVVLKLDGTEPSGYTKNVNGQVITIEVPKALLTQSNMQYEITYSAVINEKAVVATENTNTVVLNYNENKEVGTDTTKVINYQISLKKTDGQTKATLGGAKFKLYTAAEGGEAIKVVLVSGGEADSEENSVYRVAKKDEASIEEMITSKTGIIEVRGLNNGDYYFEETEAPAGYNKLTSRTAACTINNQNASELPVENNTGSVLPSTGGIGTTIFYIIGGLLIVAAVVFFVVRRKNDAE